MNLSDLTPKPKTPYVPLSETVKILNEISQLDNEVFDDNCLRKKPWPKYLVEIANTKDFSKKEVISIFAKNEGMASTLALRKSKFQQACVESVKKVG